MTYDVVVVGGGIGGLTVAALLAARGVNTCLLERQSQVGGCVARTEFSGYDFDPGMGLYTSFGHEEIYDRLFAELPVSLPETKLIEAPYVVRLANDVDVRLHRDQSAFTSELERTFPECAQTAIAFYERVNQVNVASDPDSNSLGTFKGIRKLFSSRSDSGSLERLRDQTALAYTTNTSSRFQRFVDAQLCMFVQTSLERCDFLSACRALSLPLQNAYSIAGGPATLAERLAEAIKLAGGVVRLNSPVLRLAYDETGTAVGVDLLSGETVHAKRAIVSNMTIWDTYGKLVGLNRTPAEVKTKLYKLQSQGAYLLYATIDASAVGRLPADHFLVAENEPNLDETLSSEMAITIRPEVIDGKRAVTVKTTTEVASWFSFQSSEEEYVERDQAALENLWARLHRAVPELGASIEAIETGSPRTYYDQTRRKLGMVMGFERTPSQGNLPVKTSISHLFVVGDTTSAMPDLPSVAETAISLANKLTE